MARGQHADYWGLEVSTGKLQPAHAGTSGVRGVRGCMKGLGLDGSEVGPSVVDVQFAQVRLSSSVSYVLLRGHPATHGISGVSK